MGVSFLIIGLAVAFNLVTVIWKFRHSRILDAMTDAGFLLLVTIFFSGTYGSLVIGTIGSAVVSFYLLINPPKFSNIKLRPNHAHS